VRIQHGGPHQVIQRSLVIFPIACDQPEGMKGAGIVWMVLQE
jgi:hypothetical protein